jgi:hypothetical protein
MCNVRFYVVKVREVVRQGDICMRAGQILLTGMLTLVLIGPVAAEECDINDTTLQKPDLTALAPRRARVAERDGIRRLYFTTVVANLGKGPLIINAKTVDTAFGPVTQGTQVIRRSNGTTCEHPAGTFTFHQSHNHFHLNDFGSYQLRKDDPFTGPLVAEASKVSFCLTDIEPQRGFDGQRQVRANCGVQEGTQGISSGWADVYDDFYPEQYIDLDLGRTDGGVPAGQYFLVNVADPDNLLIEDHDDVESNSGVVSVNVPARIGGQPFPTATTAPPSISPTPKPTATSRPVITRPPRPTRAPRQARPTIVRSPRPTRTPRP